MWHARSAPTGVWAVRRRSAWRRRHVEGFDGQREFHGVEPDRPGAQHRRGGDCDRERRPVAEDHRRCARRNPSVEGGGGEQCHLVVCRPHASSSPQRRIRCMGPGQEFTASIHSIADNHEVSEVRYFGDLDVSGVRIPYSASHIANNNGLPPVQPAANLYSDLLAFGHSWRGTEKALDETQANELVAWLKAEHQRPVAQLLTSGRRIPQEWVGFRHLRQTKEWHPEPRLNPTIGSARPGPFP